MLRVCTNVPNKENGTRAIGTFIPATNPDGKPNPVLEKVLRGETYVGRAFVVDDWYATAYKPIFDKDKKVVGALFVGSKPDTTALRNGIMNIVPGKTGYVYILGGSDEQRENTSFPSRENETAKISGTPRTPTASCSFNPSSKRQWRRKTANATSNVIRGSIKAKASHAIKWPRVTYFKPWDWVIGASAYEDDYRDTFRKWTRPYRNSFTWG